MTHLKNMDRLSFESKLQKSVVARKFLLGRYWVEVHHTPYGYLKCLMLDLEWRLVGLGNLALGCHRFLLLLKASRLFEKHKSDLAKHPG